MEKDLMAKIKATVENEPYAKFLNIKVIELKPGHSVVEMNVKKDYENFFAFTHGGAIFSLADVALGSAANANGNIAVALNVNINYINPAFTGNVLRASAREISRKVKVATYDIIVENEKKEIIAKAMATTYIKKEKVSSLQ